MEIRTYAVWTLDLKERVSPRFDSYIDLEMWINSNPKYSDESKYRIRWI